MRVAIVDYGSGNLRSAAKAFERAGYEADVGLRVAVTADPAEIRAADRIVLPGVGAFADCYRGLDSLTGMIEALRQAVLERGRPFLGICVGMQLLADRGLEHGVHAGLGWLHGDVALIEPVDTTLKIPHMGWNELEIVAAHPVLAGLNNGDHAYFVHSYAFHPRDVSVVNARSDYGGPVTAMVARDNIVGTQFHPEKSQRIGLRLISNFLRWRP